MKTLKNWQLFTLFLAGVFFGGCLDHIIFAAKGSGTSHYGYEIGIGGNWLMSLFDGAVTLLLIWLSLKKTGDSSRQVHPHVK
jgi:hypothetical protein